MHGQKNIKLPNCQVNSANCTFMIASQIYFSSFKEPLTNSFHYQIIS